MQLPVFISNFNFSIIYFQILAFRWDLRDCPQQYDLSLDGGAEVKIRGPGAIRKTPTRYSVCNVGTNTSRVEVEIK